MRLLEKVSCVLLALCSSSLLHAQTFVSGVLSVNTTWTLPGSPYIIPDTLTVNPNVTLSIDPGVVVKFDPAAVLILDQSSLLAEGTVTDSIVFTSNGNQAPGTWKDIFQTGPGNHPSRLSYCRIEYAIVGFQAGNTGDSILVKHCLLRANTYGTYGAGFWDIDASTFDQCEYGMQDILNARITNCRVTNCQTGINASQAVSIRKSVFTGNVIAITGLDNGIIDSCNISGNQSGITGVLSGNTITNCLIDSNSVVGIFIDHAGTVITSNKIDGNETGLFTSWNSSVHANEIKENNVGIKIGLNTFNNSISGNCICSNNIHGMWNNTVNDMSFPNNFWCMNDSANIEGTVYDQQDDPILGRIRFMPFDTSCSITAPANSIAEDFDFENSLSLYPNPFTESTVLHSGTPLKNATVTIYNSMGEIVRVMEHVNGTEVLIKREQAVNGIYLVQVVMDGKRSVKKLLLQ